jgi:hypothetical protein
VLAGHPHILLQEDFPIYPSFFPTHFVLFGAIDSIVPAGSMVTAIKVSLGEVDQRPENIKSHYLGRRNKI